uniref:Homologous recombination OB-fold protein OB-fold domain-containing protein n=1 Tax=Cajanus cajan TaxID=3821 RepID=A0A151QP92_CAJCA|nr:hypothetical protein KK1_047291 [Cajanus cajan]
MSPTGRGNYTINLKDSTATIGASLHYKVKQHQQYGEDIVVGCILVLKQVVVFAPNRNCGPYFLNITKNNVQRVSSVSQI